MQRRSLALLVATGWCSVIFMGCGASDPLGRQAISGEVNVDGQPLKDGSISFEPIEKSVTSSGAVIQDGNYAIIQEQGLPPGKYRVVVNALKPGTGMTLPEGKMPGEEVGTPPEELIPAAWNTSSKNTIEVTPSGDNHFVHDIVTKK